MNITLASHRGAHADASIIVCGCGASALEIADVPRPVTIGVNDIGRLFDPDYLVVVNPRGQFKPERFRYVEQSRARALFTQLDLGRVKPPVVRFKLGRYGGTDIRDDGTLHYTQNSPYVAVCLAALMGAKRIGLIGVDFTDHHFFGDTGRHPLARQLATIDAQYGRLAAALAQRGVELVNLSSRSRLASLPKSGLASFAGLPAREPAKAEQRGALRIVSYATTPVAGVPAILARCIETATEHSAQCVWAADRYDNGVEFSGGVQWRRQPREAVALLEAADVVIVHNGKVDPAHRRLLQSKPVVTMAHNYGWNVDMQFVNRGSPGVVVGQYQATLPEFAGWGLVPNPIPLWEPEHSPADKNARISIAFTPHGRHERYPANHRLYWHGKGYDTTMRVLDRLARRADVCIETTAQGQVSHAQALAMKRRAHIVIDECVTGSYHRNSLEGLAAGCVVVNGVGLLAGVEEALRRCAPDSERMPFVFSSLDALEENLLRLIDQGAAALAAQGRGNREWMQRHWNFAQQWPRFWQAVCDPQRAPQNTLHTPPPAAPVRAALRNPASKPAIPGKEPLMKPAAAATTAAVEPVSVIVPHGGAERLPHLEATLATLRQRAGIREIIVAEMGAVPLAKDVARRWADKHLFIEHHGAFERARALNAAEAVADSSLLLWHDNDLLMPPGFVQRAARELRERRLDFLIPYSSVGYLSPSDSQRVMQGICDPGSCRPENTLFSRSTPFGAMGLVSRDFLKRHGGFVEGFRGWGGEDNAWNHKIALLGRAGRTQRQDQHVHHLHHPSSGGYGHINAGKANPHYQDNVALMHRVCAVRTPAEFARQFPAAPPTPGELTRYTAAEPVADDALTVWTYWEGPCPDWIRACWSSIAAAAPKVRLLTPESFDALRDRDRDIDLSRLQIAHRADYIRMFLLQRYGGLWIDADCLVMQPLQAVLDLLADHDMVGHRERSGLVSNGFVAARAGSRIASAVYERICRILRSHRPLGWTTIGSEPLTAVIAENASGWHELACERVQPICWSQPEAFFAQRSAAEHERAFDPQAICYMLSNTQIRSYVAQHPQADLLQASTFFSYLQQRTIGAGSDSSPRRFEEIFTRHAQLYRQYQDESISGPGSSLNQTQELRERLPLLLSHLGIRSLVDAPCGDFNWMRHVQLGVEQYTGIDILAATIADNQARYDSPARQFVSLDLMHEPLPRADAILCRDLLPHLAYAEIVAVLKNFRRSGATYLITTNFTEPRPNLDTAEGQWRPLNFNAPPFNFPQPLLTINEKCTENGGIFKDKNLAVWRLADVPLQVLARIAPVVEEACDSGVGVVEPV
jgi:hypothetical protein